ncbi:unnamed protein product [Anisakis simplex]|uniref:Mesoderm induction early response 1 related (inferred by orthology to a S. mansoni protein) n=1 Tax=Anisakis simplex TaxID=6269 RepID=A0A0M3JWS3_ANISI|nr:unnamed protein product [Anisakis simplex]
MTDEEHGDSRITDASSYTEEDYEEAEEIYDDEGTLDEEEREHPEEDYRDELKMLEDDANLSVEELRRRYYGSGEFVVEEDDDDDNDNEVDDDEEQSSSAHSEDSAGTPQGTETDDTTSISNINGGANADGCATSSSWMVSTTTNKVKRKTDSRGYFSDEEDNEEDDEYVPPDPWRKNVRQGPFYQATIPAFIAPDINYPCAERELLLWRPPPPSTSAKTTKCNGTGYDVEMFLRTFYEMAFNSSVSAQTADLSRLSAQTQQQQPLRDDENALKVYMDTGYDAEAAMSLYPFPLVNAPQMNIGPNPSKWTDTVSFSIHRYPVRCFSWCLHVSDIDVGVMVFSSFSHKGLKVEKEVVVGRKVFECTFISILSLLLYSFVSAVVIINVVVIRFFQLPYRTVGELVQFYYIWKKTERHDMFEERICATKRHEHSNCTDYMGSLMEHMDATTGDTRTHLSSSTPLEVTSNISMPSANRNISYNISNDNASGNGISYKSDNANASYKNSISGELVTVMSTNSNDMMSDKEWNNVGCWQGATTNQTVSTTTATTTLPHLDNDTIANVLQ